MSCSCHINPPCSYCTSKYECSACGEFKHEEDDEPNIVGNDKRIICTSCYHADNEPRSQHIISECVCGSYSIGFKSHGLGHAAYCPMSKDVE